MQTTHKRQRRKKKATQLNDLGDDVLSHILSYLTLGEAMQTSILCKRWQYIWVPHPFLKLNQKRFQSTYGFLKFVQRIMTLRGSSKLYKFYLKSRTDSSSAIESLISAAAKCDVEECDLYLKAELKDPIFFPYMVHSSTTLTSLVIKMNHQVQFVAHPSICLLPNLKLLKLQCVTFFEQRPTQCFFSGCLVLEELHLEHCLWEGVTTITIASSILHTLVIREPLCDFSCDPKIADEFVICGEDLKQFYYQGRFFFNYHFLKNQPMKPFDLCCFRYLDEYQELIESRHQKLLSQIDDDVPIGGYRDKLNQITECPYCV